MVNSINLPQEAQDFQARFEKPSKGTIVDIIKVMQVGHCP